MPKETMSKAARDVIAERQRQKSEEGFTLAKDIEANYPGRLALAAAAYAAQTGTRLQDPTVVMGDVPPTLWPFAPETYKPLDIRKSLIKSAALLLAEAERYDAENK